MTLVAVLVKRDRCKTDSNLNFHSFKCFGGVIDTKAVHGRGHYVRRVTGQDQQVVMRHLLDIVNQRQEHVNNHTN